MPSTAAATARDRSADHGIPFVVGHAPYMQMIHGAKAKNNRRDMPLSPGQA
jgi:hypothetical protein